MLIIANRRELDMEIKFKENVNVESFTFKKAVEENVISMIELNNKYLHNDICFYTMIAFLNNLCEDNTIIDLLSAEDKTLDNIENEIEPLFKEKIINNEEYLKAFNEIVNDLSDYYYEDVLNKRTIGGLLYSIAGTLSEFSEADLAGMVKAMKEAIEQGADKLNINIPEIKAKMKQAVDGETLTEEGVKKDIENLKMKALVEKYTRLDNKENAAE